MGDKAIKTKADLYAMLAEAVRNTQPQPVLSDPVRDPQPAPKRNTQPAPKYKTRPAPKKRTVKIKRVRR
jgi:hypothetical protein